MTQKITSVNIEATTLSSFTGPTISSIAIANSTYVLLDDTAVSNAGGYAVITGSNFTSGAQVSFGSTPATAVTFVNSTTLNVQVPELTAGSYVTYVQNDDGSTAIKLNGITSSPIPVWATESTLTPQTDGVAISVQLSATSDSSVVYSVADGSSLPSGTTLSSSGLFSGTISGLSGDTTYNFSVNAIDAENQETLRSFSVLVSVDPGDPFFKNTVLLLNGERSNNTWITDVSANKFALTVAGDTRPNAFSPYGTVRSNYFDGTGDWLSLTSQANLALGTTDFTIEFWVYIALNTIPTNITFYDQRNNTNGFSVVQPVIELTSGTGYAWYSEAANKITTGTSVVRLNAWQHVAVSRSGTTTRMFIDGVQAGSSFTDTLNYPAGSLNIGRANDGVSTRNHTGYISNLRVVIGTALYTSTFTPSTSPLTAITNTRLLTCQSNRLIDNSTNNFTITRNGDVSVSNFGPFVETDTTTGSGYFDGTGDYIDAPSNVAFTLGTSDFTIEGYLYLISGTTGTLYDSRTGPTTISPVIYLNTGALTYFVASNRIDGPTLVAGQWHHIAVSRSGTSTKLFLNGEQVGLTYTDTNNYVIGGPKIGAGYNNSNLLNGYISNLRVLKGTALYTSNTAPPTAPLTATADTSLLTLQSRIGENNNRFIDTSGINSIITRSGNTSQGTFSPFQIGGWSNFFDGTGDYISTADNAVLNPGTQDFVMEAWVYFTGTTGANQGINGKGTAGTDGYSLFITNALVLSFIWNGTGGTTITGGTLSLNTWNHVAVVRNNSVIRLYLNGVGAGSSTACTTDITSTATKFIGQARGANPMLGYISNYRMMKGSRPSGYDATSSSLTVPSLPLTAVANTSILTCADYGIVDDSINNFSITRTGDTLVEAFSPFKVYSMTANTNSVYFDGTGDYLSIADSVNLQLGSGDFTAEGWFNSLSTKTGSVVSFYTKGVNTTGGIIFGVSSDHVFCRHTTSTDLIFNSGTGTNSNQWIHVAWVRNGNQLTIYRNGANVASASVSFNQNDTSVAQIGSVASVASATNRFGGYASNFRIVKGTAVYTSNFTPPTSPLTAITNTNLLLCSSNTLIDLSTANTGGTPFLVTATGTPRPTMVNPMGFTTSNVTGTSAEYSITSEGASGYYDGTGDYLAIADKADLRPGTSNFTLEAWIYRNAAGAAHTIYAKGGTSTGILFQVTATNILRFTHTTTNIDSTVTVPAKSWVHVAVIREGTSTNQTKLYINGVTVAQGTVSTDFTQTEEVRVGTNRAAGENFNGYISSLRFIKGQALYTSSFITSLSPSTQTPNTTLLINNTNGAIINYSRRSNLETIGDVKNRNNVVKYGNTSMYFDGTGDMLRVNLNASNIYNQMTSSGKVNTIEFWLYLNSFTNPRAFLMGSWLSSAGWTYDVTPAGDIFVSNDNAGSTIVLSSKITAGSWQHLAIVNNGTNIIVYRNGTNVGSVAVQGPASYVGPLMVGMRADSTLPLNGYIDDLRITSGIARYTANFTAPTTSFSRR